MEMLAKGYDQNFHWVVRFYRGRRGNPSRLPLTEIVNGISKSAVVLFAGMVLWRVVRERRNQLCDLLALPRPTLKVQSNLSVICNMTTLERFM